jgi:hypothetical protein
LADFSKKKKPTTTTKLVKFALEKPNTILQIFPNFFCFAWEKKMTNFVGKNLLKFTSKCTIQQHLSSSMNCLFLSPRF